MEFETYFGFIFYLVADIPRVGVMKEFKSNLSVKYNGTVRRLKPFKIKIEGAWESRKEREHRKPC